MTNADSKPTIYNVCTACDTTLDADEQFCSAHPTSAIDTIAVTNPTALNLTAEILTSLTDALTAQQQRDQDKYRICGTVLDHIAARNGKRYDKRDAAAIKLKLNDGETYEVRRAAQMLGRDPDALINVTMWRCTISDGWRCKELTIWHSDHEHAFRYDNRITLTLPTSGTCDEDALIADNPWAFANLVDEIAKRGRVLSEKSEHVARLAMLAETARDAMQAARAMIEDLGVDECALARLVEKHIERAE